MEFWPRSRNTSLSLFLGTFVYGVWRFSEKRALKLSPRRGRNVENICGIFCLVAFPIKWARRLWAQSPFCFVHTASDAMSLFLCSCFVTCLVMPPNCNRRCRLCGKKGADVRSCNIKGAAKFQSLLALQSHTAKAGTSRVLRGIGEAAERKAAAKAVAKAGKIQKNGVQWSCSNSKTFGLWQGPSLPLSLRMKPLIGCWNLWP